MRCGTSWSRKGFRPCWRRRGEEAIDIVRGQPVHLVLLDMHMPTLTGLETLLLVRQINAMLPAILVTGDPTESLVRQAIQAQFYSVIPKPVSKNIVLYTVLNALARFYGQLLSHRIARSQLCICFTPRRSITA